MTSALQLSSWGHPRVSSRPSEGGSASLGAAARAAGSTPKPRPWTSGDFSLGAAGGCCPGWGVAAAGVVKLAWGGGKGSVSCVVLESGQDGGFRVRFCWARTRGFRKGGRRPAVPLAESPWLAQAPSTVLETAISGHCVSLCRLGRRRDTRRRVGEGATTRACVPRLGFRWGSGKVEGSTRGACSHVSVRLLGSQTVFLGEALGSTRSPAGLVCARTWAVYPRACVCTPVGCVCMHGEAGTGAWWSRGVGVSGHLFLPSQPSDVAGVSFRGCLLPPGLRKWW